MHSLIIAHPWHGVTPRLSETVFQAYIEIVPNDTVKYELDKESGLLKVDRPQQFSNRCPFPYGFFPRTYCGSNIAKSAGTETGDKDPLDLIVVTTCAINQGNVLIPVHIIGGLLMIDKEEADDKIICILKDDPILGAINEIEELPASIMEKIKHYFLTYKLMPEAKHNQVKIEKVYDSAEALQKLALAEKDYIDLAQIQR